MNRQNSRPGLLMWALAALALAAAVARFAAGMSGLDNARYAADWNVTADQMSVQAIETPEWGDSFYDYYLVSFRLANHSQRPVDLDEYAFTAVPRRGTTGPPALTPSGTARPPTPCGPRCPRAAPPR